MSDLTLPDFILARVAVDEASVEVPEWYCTDSARGEAWGTRGDTCPLCDGYMFEGTESATEDAWVHHLDDVHDRRRVLAQCAAYRRLVDLHKVNSEPTVWGSGAGPDSGKPTGGTTYWCWTCDYDRDYGYTGGPREGCETLRALALVWADHPDYRQEWRP